MTMSKPVCVYYSQPLWAEWESTQSKKYISPPNLADFHEGLLIFIFISSVYPFLSFFCSFLSSFLCFFSTWFIMFPFQVTSKRELPWIFLNHDFILVYWIAKISAKDSPTANVTAPHIPHRPHPCLPAIQFSVDCISGTLLGLNKERISSHGLHPTWGRNSFSPAKRWLWGSGADNAVMKKLKISKCSPLYWAHWIYQVWWKVSKP